MVTGTTTQDDLFVLRNHNVNYVVHGQGKLTGNRGNWLELLALIPFWIPAFAVAWVFLTQKDPINVMGTLLNNGVPLQSGAPIQDIVLMAKIVGIALYVIFAVLITPYWIRRTLKNAANQGRLEREGRVVYG